MHKVACYAAQSGKSPLAPFVIDRREPLPDDVELEILWAGVCHSDLHSVRAEWEDITFPIVPGHEIVGRVTRVGSAVKRFRVGQIAAVGVMVDSCRACPHCTDGLEQYCDESPTFTYNSEDKRSPGLMTYGGYSKSIVVTQDFVLELPGNLDLAGAAPLLCAGITMYSPLKHFGVGPNRKVGIIGLGGLGHMAVKFSRAFGAHTVLFTTSASKVEDGLRLGAHEVVLSRDPAAMSKHERSFDFILDSVAAPHDLGALCDLLKRDATLCLVGIPPTPNAPPDVVKLISKRRRIAGSMIGGIRETQEMLNFCGQHGIVADVERIRMEQIEEAYARMLRSDVKYRFVIDMAAWRA